MKRMWGADKVTFSKLERTSEGFLRGELSIARTGIYEYKQDGKTIKKAKLEDSLFSDKNINSLRGAPMTDGHPMDADGVPVEVNADNFEKYAVGNVSEPRREGDRIKALGVIYDSDLADDVESGEKDQLSAGFLFREGEGGDFEGEAYDASQEDIISNHVAVVEFGRAGQSCSFNTDAKEEGIMPKWRTHDEKEIEITGDNASVILSELTHYKSASDDVAGKLQMATDSATETATKIEKLEKDLAEAKKSPAPTGDEKERIEKLEKDVKTLTDKLELAGDEKKKLEGDLKEATDAEPKMIEDRVATRVKLESDAKAFSIDSCEGMSDRQVMEQVIQAGDLAYPEGEKIGDKKDEAIADRFASTVDRKREQLNSADVVDGSGSRPEGDVRAEIKKGRDGRGKMHNQDLNKEGGSK